MYYVELIDRFWVFNEKARPGHAAIALYFYLLQTAKVNDTYQLSVSDVELSKSLGLSRSTVKVTKQKLKDIGLIQYTTRNGYPGLYRLIVNYPVEILNVQNVKKDIVEEIMDFPDQQNDSQLSEEGKADRTMIKDITSFSSGLFAENKSIPNLSVFLSFAKNLDAYSPELDSLITEKYYSWLSKGWKSISDRPITNWKSSLKSILPFLKSEGEDDKTLIHTTQNIRYPLKKS